MISSASNAHHYHQVHAAASTATVTATQSTHTTQPVHPTQSTHTDSLEEGKNGFKNAWLRQLEQEKHVQNTGVTNDHTRVQAMQETQHMQKVSDMLAQERQKKV